MKTAERSCGVKIQYTREDAKRVVTETRARNRRHRNQNHESLQAYPCPFEPCKSLGLWHVGHNGASPLARSSSKKIKRWRWDGRWEERVED